MSLRVHLLGPTEAFVDDDRLALSRAQVRRALAFLAANNGTAVSSDLLIDALWTDDLPKDPRATLLVIVSRLRTALEHASTRLRTADNGYVLDAETDIDTFHAAIERSRSSSGEEAIEALREALSLWRGTPFDDVGDAPAFDQLRSGLVETQWFALARLGELLVEQGASGEAVEALTSFFQDQPHRERVAVCLARALALEGRKADALATLGTTRNRLRDDLGVEPSSFLGELERDILQGSVELPGRSRSVQRPVADLLVGHTHERAALIDPNPGVTVLVGEPGIGKSTLLAEATRTHASIGRSIFTVTANETPQRPMEPVLDMLDQLVVESGELAREPDYREVLGRLGIRGVESTSTTALTRETLLSTAASYIIEAAHQQNAVLVIDDCHWLDRGSAQAFELVVKDPATRVLAASRPSDLPYIGYLFDAELVQRIDVAGLGIQDTRRLVAHSLPRGTDDELMQELHELSGGNPLFLSLLVGLVAEGELGGDALPTSILVAVQERVDALSARAIDTLRTASVIGQRFPLPLLRQLAPHADTDLAEADRLGLVRIDPATDEGWFVHQLVTEAVYQMLAAAFRVELHDEVGRILEREGASAVEYVTHCSKAVEIDRVRACDAHVAAADQFAEAYAWDAAMEHLDHARREIDLAGLTDQSLDAEATVLRGTIERIIGLAESDKTLLHGAELARASGNAELFGTAVRELCSHGRTTAAGTSDAQVIDLLDEAVEMELTDATRALMTSAATVLFSLSDSDRARALFLESVDLARRSEDPRVVGEVLRRAHLGLSSPDDLDVREQIAGELYDIAQGDPDLRWEAALLRFGVALARADRAGLDASIEAMRANIDQIASGNRDVGSNFTEAAYAHVLGDLDQAEEYARRAFQSSASRYTSSWATMIYGGLLLGIRSEQGRLGELLPVFQSLDADPSFATTLNALITTLAVHADETELARSTLDDLTDAAFTQLPRDHTFTSACLLLTESAVFFDDRVAATLLFDLLEPYSGQMSYNSMGTQGPVDFALAQLALVLDDVETARYHDDKARDIKQRLGLEANRRWQVEIPT